MKTQIEKDNDRIAAYQKFKNNILIIEELFRQGDFSVRLINQTLTDIQTAIDGEDPDNAFTKDDFDSMLNTRNEILSPIFRSVSFTQSFDYYTPLVVIPEEGTSEEDIPLLDVPPIIIHENVIPSGEESPTPGN